MNPTGPSSPNPTLAAPGAAPLSPGPVVRPLPMADGSLAVLESLYDAVVLTNLTGSVQACNHRAVELLGYSHADLCRQMIGQLVTGLTQDLLRTIAQQLSVGRFTVLEGRCTRQNGTIFPAEIAVGATALAEGRGLCFSLRNITQRREMQNRLRLAQNAMQSSASALVMADLNSKLQYANPAFCQMWAVAKPEDVLGKSLDDFFGAAHAAVLRACLESKLPWIGELAFPRPDGSTWYCQATSAPNFDHQNVLVGVVLSFIDITQRKRAEEKIHREVAAQLQRARSQDDFSGQLNIIALPELIQFIDSSGKTGRLEVVNATAAAKVVLSFEGGRIVSACCGELRGEPAVYAALRFDGQSFTFHQTAELERDPSITKPTMSLLLDGVRHLDEAAQVGESPPV